MIKIHSTKKLEAKLPTEIYLLSSAAADPVSGTIKTLSGWHVNLLTIQRRYCVLMVHDASGFALFMLGC